MILNMVANMSWFFAGFLSCMLLVIIANNNKFQ